MSAARRVVATPLTAAAFAPFGTVIAWPERAGRPINGGTSLRADLLDALPLSADGGRPMLAVFRAAPRAQPLRAVELECHRLGSQLFVPLGGARMVLLVAPAGPAPRADALRAFVTDGAQGIALAPGTWHHGLIAPEGGDFAVIERAAAAVDCDLAALDPAVELAWA